MPVRVIYPGRAGRGPGPDFRGALIAGPSGVTLRGDVELHVRSSSFRAHGHERDPAYAGVVLHVVFEDDTGADTPLPGGAVAPVVALAPWVARRAGELERWLERPLLWREPCHDALTRLGPDRAAAALEAEGDRRLAAKVGRFAAAVRAGGPAGGAGQAVYEGLLEALGYGGNAPPALALARLLPWQQLSRRASTRDEMEALLLGSAGLLPSQRGHRGPLEPDVVALEATFSGAALPSLPAGVWKLWGIRPENAPARRIAGAAALLASAGSPASLLSCLRAGSVREALAPLLTPSPEGYWRHHHDLCAGPARLPPAFIGRSRALEILLNVLIPVALAVASEDDSNHGDGSDQWPAVGSQASGSEAELHPPSSTLQGPGEATELAAAATRLWRQLPRPGAYGITRFLENALASEGVRLPLNARRSQGLLALHRDWCTQGGCGRCPLS